jgi:hypothetical protein
LHDMKFLRAAYTRNVIAFLAGVAFFNLGFVQSEISLLDLKGNQKLFQNIVNNTFEEESENGAESSEEDPLNEAIDFSIFHHDLSYGHLVFSIRKNSPFNSLFLNPGYKSTFSPPPEVFILS